MSPRDWAVTDIQPRTMMCPLPKGYHWEVSILQGLDSVHLDLVKRWSGSVEGVCAVLDFSQTSTDRAARQIIDRSYTMWQKYFRASTTSDEWQARANELRGALSNTAVKVTFRVEQVK